MFQCKNGHKLCWTARSDGYSTHMYRCDICGGHPFKTDDFRYACIQCQYDVCHKCRPNITFMIGRCKNGHKLAWSTSYAPYPSKYYNCDLCGHTHLDSTLGRYTCRPCNFDLCKMCRQFVEDTKKKCFKNHVLEWTTVNDRYKTEMYSCDVCTKNMSTTLGRYACIPCEYDICNHCRAFESSTSVGWNELTDKLGGMKIGGEAQQAGIAEGKLCNICCSGPVNAAFCPCGHTGACYDCGKKLQKCPFCNGKVDNVLKLFIA